MCSSVAFFPASSFMAACLYDACLHVSTCMCGICLFPPECFKSPVPPRPAASVSKVQEVVDRLRISSIQHRCEDDADVHRYLHCRAEEVRKVMPAPAFTSRLTLETRRPCFCHSFPPQWAAPTRHSLCYSDPRLRMLVVEAEGGVFLLAVPSPAGTVHS